MIKEIIFCDTNEDLCIEISKLYKKYKDALPCRFSNNDLTLTIKNQKFETIDTFDAIVTAGNSFGVMTGGIDLYVKRFFNNKLIKKNSEKNFTGIAAKIQKQITEQFFGEIPVGSSMITETGVHEHPFIVYTPTMRTPYILSGDSQNIYNSVLSAIIEIRRHNNKNSDKIESVIFCGMGTGTGNFPVKSAANQMVLAWLNGTRNTKKSFYSLENESEYSLLIYPDIVSL